MRREWRWILVASAVLALGAIGAKPYATLAVRYYTVVARWMAGGHPTWDVVDVEVAPGTSGSGAIVRLRGTVREQTQDAAPAARLTSKLQAAVVVESPVVFWTVLLLWPLRSCRERLGLLVLGIPVFLCLEAATTVCQLLNPLAFASAVLAGQPDEITTWERWGRFLEGGGRPAVALAAALLNVTLIRFICGTSISNNSALHS
jgi:hypothetical protein